MGTSCRNGQRVYQSKDHPHACGDKRDIHHPNLQAVGSSPRVWGQEDGFYQAEEDGRIIPTRVGTSLIFIVFSPPQMDHPHACGDKRGVMRRCCHWIGSSPRVWGQAVENFLPHQRNRIIPTRVGTSKRYSHTISGIRDHPHACGDKKAVHREKV